VTYRYVSSAGTSGSDGGSSRLSDLRGRNRGSTSSRLTAAGTF